METSHLNIKSYSKSLLCIKRTFSETDHVFYS